MTKPNMLLRSQQISDAEWHVHIDDHVLLWDNEYLEYDLSK